MAKNQQTRDERIEQRMRARAPLIAECLTVVFDADASLAEHLDSVSLAFREIADPVKKVRVQDEGGRTRSVDADEAIDWLRAHPGFQTYEVVPESEGKTVGCAWLPRG